MSKSGYTFVRFVFCWLNVILWISGCGLMGVGLWLRIAYEGYASLLPQYAFLSADSLAIAIGTVVFVLTFFGCFGSWFQNRCMLMTYFTLVVVVFIAEFLVSSMAFVFRANFGYVLKQELQEGLWHHYNVSATGPNSLVAIWDNIQTQFKCCGVVDYQDWFLIDAWPNETWAPDSCCLPERNFTHCGRLLDVSHFHATGCYLQIHMWFVQRLHIVGVVGLAVAFIQLYGLISSMLLFCTIKHRRPPRQYKTYYT